MLLCAFIWISFWGFKYFNLAYISILGIVELYFVCL